MQPVDFDTLNPELWRHNKYSLGFLLEKNAQKLPVEKAKLVIIGIGEDRNAVCSGSGAAPDLIRKELYRLNRVVPRLRIRDFGNIRLGNSATDTYFAVKDVCAELREAGTVIVALGGSQDLTVGLCRAFDNSPFSLVCIDPKPDFRKDDKKLNSENYLNLVFRQPNLVNQATLGCQNYFSDIVELDALQKAADAEVCRLGFLRDHWRDIEPYMREARIVSFDINALRLHDAPAQDFASPNGLHGEEACGIARYAGLGDNVRIAGFFNLLPQNDVNGVSCKLMAQTVWHFIEGFVNRKPEFPENNRQNIQEYIVDQNDIGLKLAFYNSLLTNRWWMKIYDAQNDVTHAVACSESDYRQALQSDIPDRWLRYTRKLNRPQK